MFKFKDYRFRYFNIRMILLILSLAVIGILFVRSATIGTGSDTFNKQIFGVVLGAACMLFVAMVDYHWVLSMYWLLYVVNIGILLATKFMGISGNSGAQRWLVLPGIGQIQPSEFSKILMICFFAMFFYKHREKISKVQVVLASLLLFAVPAYLIFDQPNLSTTLVVTFIFLVLIYVAKISYKWILGTLAVLVPSAVWFIYYIQQEGQKLPGALSGKPDHVLDQSVQVFHGYDPAAAELHHGHRIRSASWKRNRHNNLCLGKERQLFVGGGHRFYLCCHRGRGRIYRKCNYHWTFGASCGRMYLYGSACQGSPGPPDLQRHGSSCGGPDLYQRRGRIGTASQYGNSAALYQCRFKLLTQYFYRYGAGIKCGTSKKL